MGPVLALLHPSWTRPQLLANRPAPACAKALFWASSFVAVFPKAGALANFLRCFCGARCKRKVGPRERFFSAVQDASARVLHGARPCEFFAACLARYLPRYKIGYRGRWVSTSRPQKVLRCRMVGFCPHEKQNATCVHTSAERSQTISYLAHAMAAAQGKMSKLCPIEH